MFTAISCKKAILLVVLSLFVMSLMAQEKTDRFLQMTLAGDYKGLRYSDGAAPSFGYTAGIDFINGQFLVGAGFDNGIRNKSMDQYNTFLFARIGYVLEASGFRFCPFLRTGWFMDVRSVDERLNGYHQVLSAFGIDIVFRMSEWIWLRASAEYELTSLLGKGGSATFGLVIPLYYFQ